MQELVAGDGIEVGLSPAGRYVVDLQQQVSADETRPLVRAGTDGLVVVTGGARGVTAACVDELTRKYRPNLLLLGRTPDPDSEPQWCRHLPDDQLEEVLFQHKGTEATPAAIRAEANTIRNSREIGARIRSLEALGSTVQYRSVDVRDRHALEQVIGACSKDSWPCARNHPWCWSTGRQLDYREKANNNFNRYGAPRSLLRVISSPSAEMKNWNSYRFSPRPLHAWAAEDRATTLPPTKLSIASLELK